MYFLVVLAFSLLLADDLPPPSWNLWPLQPGDAWGRSGTITATAAGLSVLLAGLVAAFFNAHALRRYDGSNDAIDRAQERNAFGAMVCLATIGACTGFLYLCTPWIPLIRQRCGLPDWPLLADLVLLSPFLASVLVVWLATYPTERVIRIAAMDQRVLDGVSRRPVWPRHEYLIYKLRHQVLIVAVPMLFILLAEHYLDRHRGDINGGLRIPWAADALLGLASGTVLLLSPVLVRAIWTTRVLPPGPLRERLEKQCARIGLRYRNILVWDSHGLIVNAAVMGFVSRLRYILLSDGLIETMGPRQVEAVFGHEAGHVRHHHLQYFMIFALLSMLAVGGVLEVLVRSVELDPATLQLVALVATLAVWGGGFGWVSRNFERQADVFGVRAITADVDACSPACAIHGTPTAPGAEMTAGALCLGAMHVFGRTLQRIADLNGIPRDAPSWRHGSINSRCSLIFRLADSPTAVSRFERRIWRLKAVLVGMTIIGCGIAAWMYWPSQFFERWTGRAVLPAIPTPVDGAARSVHAVPADMHRQDMSTGNVAASARSNASRKRGSSHHRTSGAHKRPPASSSRT